MLDSVLNKRLYGQLRQDEIGSLDVILDIQLIGKSQLFDVQILINIPSVAVNR